MAGHSRWKKIKHQKGAADAKRGKIFTRLIREITVCARKGGGDPNFNPALRAAVAAGRQANMPSDTIERAIKKGSGELGGAILEEISYEGYGPAGVAMIIEVITDNKNRTVSELRNCLTKCNGNLATSGAVSWIFTKKGIITVNKRDTSEEKLLDIVLDAGAEDVKGEDEVFEIYCSIEIFESVKEALEKQKVPTETAELTMIPQSTIHLVGKDAEHMLKLMEILEDHDDVQKVHANFDIDDQILEKLAS